ncbi:MAG: hypothetical protein AAGE59_04915 [Cyanobacteria bacterium P01_F01_bin.86]
MPNSLPPRSSMRKQSSALARRSPGAVQVLVQRQRYFSLPSLTFAGRWLRLGGITMGLFGAGSFVSLCLWISAVFILSPYPPRWLAQALPYLAKNWSDHPIQSWESIEAELQLQGRLAGDLTNLANLSQDPQLDNLRLLPVLGQRSACTRNCQAIVELRLYEIARQEDQELSLQLLDKLAIQGPPEEQVVDPVWQANARMGGSTHPLPLLDVKSLHKQGLPGVWLTLTGRWQHQGSPILYGQVLHVDLQTRRINSLLNWSSPPGRLPIWQNLDNQGLPELIISQSIGIEPRFSLYTIANTTAAVAIRLKEISLNKLSFPQTTQTTQYHNALFLAQQGLWSDAQEQLTQLKTQLAQQWSQELEQQLQLVTLHARISQSQAERIWSRPGQKLLALLLDGQWETALDMMGTSQSFFETAVLPLLRQDSSRLWQRLTASLQVNPTEKAAQIWGALLLLAKEDKEAAFKWLTENQGSVAQQEFKALVDKVQPDPPEATETETEITAVEEQPAIPSTTQAETSSIAEQQPSNTRPVVAGLFGTARPLTSLNSTEWRRPSGTSELTLSTGQQWYEITLEAGSINEQWQHLEVPDAFSSEAIAAFWRSLGLRANAVLHLTGSLPGQTQTVQVKAINLEAGTAKLLASGATTQTPESWIATHPNQWVTPSQIRAHSLSQVYQEQPQLGDRLLTTLSEHLGFDPTLAASILQQEKAGAEGGIMLRWVDFTGDQQVDALLSVKPQAGADEAITLSNQETVHIVLSSDGDLLYSDLWNGGTMMGWLTAENGTPALVANRSGRYNLLIWSPQTQRFQ